MERIFVQIASYRDRECQYTLKDLFEKAAHPERVFVGMCFLRDEATDGECFAVGNRLPEHVRSIIYPLEADRGINWARMQAQSLWQGEEYVLQIHSHTRFEQGWDDLLIAQLARCPSPKPVLSSNPPGYVPGDTFPYRDETIASFTTVFKINPDEPQTVITSGKLISKGTPIPQLMRNAFAIGSFLFARSTFFQEVPYDPYIYYYNSELAFSARAWTHGYDIFQPDRYIIFHFYGRTEPYARPHRELANHHHNLSNMRVLHLLRVRLADKSDALIDLDTYGLGRERLVEDYWTFAGIHPLGRQSSEHARNGQWETPFREWVETVKRRPAKKPTIFVQMGSYRDPECQWTVKDMFEKATYPDRVTFGICWQYDPEEDKDCFEISVRPEQVRISPFHWKESQGVCWARYQAQLLYDGEDYILMIDSHMRLIFGWDELLIQELEKCNSPKPVLSNHPATYTPPHEIDPRAMPTALNVQSFMEQGDVRVSGGYMIRIPPHPLRGAFVAAGFIFARGQIVKEAPYDPYMYFNQEEMSLSFRFYTHGWDVFHPSRVFAYHLYNVGDEVKRRKLHWSDNTHWGKLADRAKARFEHLVDVAPSDDPLVTRDLMTFGLGEERTLQQFEEFSGIDFKNRAVADKAVNYGITDELRLYMRGEALAEAEEGGGKSLAFPNPAKTAELPYNIMQLANGRQRILNIEKDAPKDVLIIYDYVEPEICKALTEYADAQAFTELGVVDYENSDKENVVTQKNEGRITTHVDIDGMAPEILTIFNDIYCNRMAPFYNVDIEAYERPQILRYPAGGKYNQHADADHWLPEKNEWVRAQDRDLSVLLYLNDAYEGGELQFVNQGYTIKPKPGMVVAFPSDHRFLHAALPTTSGLRYVIVSWGVTMGSVRVRKQLPYATVFVRQKRRKPNAA